MPIVGITLDSTRDYVSKLDTAKPPEATVFVIGTLDSRIFGILRDRGTVIQVDPTRGDDNVQTSLNLNEVNFLTVQYGLRGWRNFKDSAGADIAFKTSTITHGNKPYTVVDADLLRRLPGVVISELAEEIRKENELTETEAKN
jgi:hypothetical protein